MVTRPLSTLMVMLVLSAILMTHHSGLAGAQTPAVGSRLRAEDAMAAERWDEAAHAWRQCLSDKPADEAAWVGLAQSLERNGIPEAARQALLEARQACPKSTAVLLRLGDLEQSQGRWAEAVTAWQMVYALQPIHPGATRRLVAILPKIPEPVRKPIQQSLRQRAVLAETRASQALAQGRYADAVPALRVAHHVQPTRARSNDLAVAVLLAGNPQAAEQELSRLQRQTGAWAVRANRALALLALDRPFDAQKALEQAISLCPDDPNRARLFNLLGYTYECARRQSKARFAYEKAVALDPTLRKAKQNLAYICLRQKDLEAAESLLKALQDSTPKADARARADLLTQLGNLEELRQRPKAAIRRYEAAVAQDPDALEAYASLALLHQKMNHAQAAQETYRKLAQQEFSRVERLGQSVPATGRARLQDVVDIFLASGQMALLTQAASPSKSSGTQRTAPATPKRPNQSPETQDLIRPATAEKTPATAQPAPAIGADAEPSGPLLKP